MRFIRSTDDANPGVRCNVPDRELDGVDGMFSLVHSPKLFVELGSSYGALARRACIHLPKTTKIFSVDQWIEERGRNHLFTWVQMVSDWLGSKIIGVQSTTQDAASFFKDESIDVCLVDADHGADAVYEDCAAYWPKVRPGGFLVGHDINGRWGKYVRSGVNRFFGKGNWERAPLHGDPLNEECWYVRK
jgi:predicted O-methyltransferase YrrM